MPTLLDTDRSRGETPEASAAPAPEATARAAEHSRDWPRLLTTFDLRGARYRVIPHAPEDRVEEASRLRDSPLEQSARCLMVRVRRGRRVIRDVVAVVPGDRTVDLVAVARLFGGTAASFTPPEEAERLSGTPRGAVLPFACGPELELVVAPELLEHEEIYFTAGRLDLSVAIRTEDYKVLARPRVAPIAG